MYDFYQLYRRFCILHIQALQVVSNDVSSYIHLASLSTLDTMCNNHSNKTALENNKTQYLKNKIEKKAFLQKP